MGNELAGTDRETKPTTYQFAADHAGVAVHFEGHAWFFTKYGQPQLDTNRDRIIARALLTAAIDELDAMEATR